MQSVLTRIPSLAAELLAQTTACAKLVFGSRLVVWLLATVVLVNAGVVIVRSFIEAESVAGNMAVSSLALLEEPTLGLLVRENQAIDLAVSSRLRDGIAGVLFGNTGDVLSSASLSSLDGLYTFVVPILAVLIGFILMPANEMEFSLIRGLPVSRVRYFFSLALLLGLSLFGLFAVLFVSDLILFGVLFGWESVPIAKLLHFNIFGALWGLAFGCLGLFLGALRHRASALLIGLVFIVLLIGVIPHLQQYSYEMYVRGLGPDGLEAMMRGELHLPIGIRLAAYLNFLPGSVRITAMYALLRGDFSSAGVGSLCSTCDPPVTPSMLMRSSYTSLLWFGLAFALLALIQLARRKPKT